MRRVVRSVEERTPGRRDRALDGLRALALVAVPLGHWLLGGFTLDVAGAMRNSSPLAVFGGLAPVSWVLQMLGIFFLVGGHAAVLSRNRARERGVGDRVWLGRRVARLGRPVVAVTAVWAVLLLVLRAAGFPAGTLRSAVTLVVQPLWFVGVYVVLTALTPVCVRAARRFGLWSAAALFAAVAVVDFLRYGPWSGAVPDWTGLLAVVPGWLFAYQLGIVWAGGRLDRRRAVGLLVGGCVVFAALLTVFGYPASMVGVPGQGRTNSHPPSLLVLALAAAQCGGAVLVRARLARVLARPGLWAVTVGVNLCAMTVLCWHQSAMLAVALPASRTGAVPGLIGAPDTVGWIAARLLWLPVFASVLFLITLAVRRFERPWTGMARVPRTVMGVLAVGFAAYALYG
ncbi:acyltransferase family protein [Streptomyces sp. NPDC002526]